MSLVILSLSLALHWNFEHKEIQSLCSVLLVMLAYVVASFCMNKPIIKAKHTKDKPQNLL